ncbi:DarT ssDNA thymidine ADP-ribosyltransferase family protein [Deinococcus sp. PESE-13]
MTAPVPRNPKIYHITHGDNLPRIVAEGGLWSDAAILQRGGPTAMIGMGKLM